MVEYRHSISLPLCQGLLALASSKHTKPVNIKCLGLTRNQWDNFQKLRYWGLVEKGCVDGKHIAGTWIVTKRGYDFLAGKTKLSKSVWTYRGETVRYEGETVHVDEILDSTEFRKYKQREEYAMEALPKEVNEIMESL
jgi:hypothetical protein